MNGNMMKSVCRDIGKALLWGAYAAGGCFLLFFMLGLVFGRLQLRTGLETARTALCVLTAAQLMLLAGALMLRGKRPAGFRASENGWRRRFAVIGPKSVLLCMAACAIVMTAAADALARLCPA